MEKERLMRNAKTHPTCSSSILTILRSQTEAAFYGQIYSSKFVHRIVEQWTLQPRQWNHFPKPHNRNINQIRRVQRMEKVKSSGSAICVDKNRWRSFCLSKGGCIGWNSYFWIIHNCRCNSTIHNKLEISGFNFPMLFLKTSIDSNSFTCTMHSDSNDQNHVQLRR